MNLRTLSKLKKNQSKTLKEPFLYLIVLPHHLRNNIYRDGKYDGAVVFCRNVVQSLEVSELTQMIRHRSQALRH